MALRSDSASCSAALTCGGLLSGEEDGWRGESAGPVEMVEADSARGDTSGLPEISPESVGLEEAALQDMRPTEELGCARDGERRDVIHTEPTQRQTVIHMENRVVHEIDFGFVKDP